jgi:uncharacterized ubiquitin-like protein YukD
MKDVMSKSFDLYLTGWAVSKAILEDYSEVIAKIESTSPELVKDRIMKKAQVFFDEARIISQDD